MPKDQSVVYFLKSADIGLIKIGRSNSVFARINHIRKLMGFDVQLLGVIPGGAKEEKAVHDRFDHLRAFGEWFREEQDLIDFIASNAAPPTGHGKVRLVLYITEEINDRLRTGEVRRGHLSDIVNQALKAYFRDEGQRQQESIHEG